MTTPLAPLTVEALLEGIVDVTRGPAAPWFTPDGKVIPLEY